MLQVKLLKVRLKLVQHLKVLVQLIWIKLEEMVLALVILKLSDWKKRYRTLADKHEAMISFYNVDIQYDLNELEQEFFKAVETLKVFKIY